MPGLPFEYHTRVGEFAKALLGVDQLTDAQQTAVEHWNNNDQHLEEYLKKNRPTTGGLPSITSVNAFGDSAPVISAGDSLDVSIDIPPGGSLIEMRWYLFGTTYGVASENFQGLTAGLKDGSPFQFERIYGFFPEATISTGYSIVFTAAGVFVPTPYPDSALGFRIINNSADDYLFEYQVNASCFSG